MFTDEDRAIRAFLENTHKSQVKQGMLDRGFIRLRDGMNKEVFMRDDKEFVVKTYNVLEDCQRATPFQTVRAYDERLNWTRGLTAPMHDARRETFGFNCFRQHKPKTFLFGQGRGFVFILQERVDPFNRSDFSDELKTRRLMEVVKIVSDMGEHFNRVWRPTTATVLDVTKIDNWGLTRDQDRRPVCFDGI